MKKILWLFMTLFFLLLNQSPQTTQLNQLIFNGGSRDDRAKIRTALPIAIAMIDEALTRLNGGWENLSDAERLVYLAVFDPGDTGGIDESVLRTTYENFRLIHARFSVRLKLVFVTSPYCTGTSLFFTDFIHIFVCPQLSVENDPERLARNLVHEVGHMVLLARDRPYFSETGTRYHALTPLGSAPRNLPPLLRYLFREIYVNDTLYHPDAYAHFAARLSRLLAVDSSGPGVSVPGEIHEKGVADSISFDRNLLTAAGVILQDNE